MTRFTDRVTRDLHQIADRSTPSSTAWDSIRTRIETQTDQPTTEVIMLSPDRNNSPKRGWMLAAAAGTVILIGGLVFATTRSDDNDTVPADAPQTTAPTEPAPDAEVDPAPTPEPAVEPAPDTTTVAEVVPPAEPGTVTGAYSFQDIVATTSPSSAGLVGNESWQGTVVFEGQMEGTAPGTWQTWTIPEDGSTRGLGEFVFTGTIEGLGTGTLSFTDQWQIINGLWSKNQTTITGGTGDFEGAYGRADFDTDPAPVENGTTGTYSWNITVPPTGSLVTVTAMGTRTSVEFNLPPGANAFTETFDVTGSLVGTAKGFGKGYGIPGSTSHAFSSSEFTGTIEGLGTGTMTYDTVYTNTQEGVNWMDVVTGGTGDFEGITGTGRHDPDGDVGSYIFELTAPVNQ